MSKKKSHSAPARSSSRSRSLADEKAMGGKRLKPAARNVLLGDLVFLCAAQLLYDRGIISGTVSGACTVGGIVLLIVGLWLQFRNDEHKIDRPKG